MTSTSYTTGVGPGLVNAPVAPEAIYVGIGGAEPGVSVIDLHGFGQGTGDINNTRWHAQPEHRCQRASSRRWPLARRTSTPVVRVC